jgi:rhamnopyranosyl-N-acetylglucosaminyl-diphospho-decaprenol beta-1,3/1,4-galactofuranosyltransferase
MGAPIVHVATVVVTFNRRALLEACLRALASQSRPADCVYVVDNASTDGTATWLQEWLPLHLPGTELILMPDNQGGAGGFARGLGEAVNAGADWVWMMDDDARPHVSALEELLRVSDNPANVYGSLAISGEDTSWETPLADESGRVISRVSDVPARAPVQFLPFLGFMIHRTLVEKIGLPDASFFILSDDTEYCLRARTSGAQIIIAGNSLIDHPKSERYVVHLPFRRLTYLSLPPWKRYYHTRNKLLISRRYFGVRLLTQTIPGLLFRLLAAVIHEPDKPKQVWAFCAGMLDGLLGRAGRRHQRWGINP